MSREGSHHTPEFVGAYSPTWPQFFMVIGTLAQSYLTPGLQKLFIFHETLAEIGPAISDASLEYQPR